MFPIPNAIIPSKIIGGGRLHNGWNKPSSEQRVLKIKCSLETHSLWIFKENLFPIENWGWKENQQLNSLESIYSHTLVPQRFHTNSHMHWWLRWAHWCRCCMNTSSKCQHGKDMYSVLEMNYKDWHKMTRDVHRNILSNSLLIWKDNRLQVCLQKLMYLSQRTVGHIEYLQEKVQHPCKAPQAHDHWDRCI